MWLLSRLIRGYLLRRLFAGGGRRSRSGRWGGPYSGYGYGRRGRGGLFPFPHYSTRTRGGARVSVGGCCLPLALGILAAILAPVVATVHAVLRTRAA